MALAVDGSSPALWSETSLSAGPKSLTSASFTAPAGSLLVVCVEFDNYGANTVGSISDSGGLTWTLSASQDGPFETSWINGFVRIWTAPAPSAVSRTITISRTSAATAPTWAKCYVVTGQAASPTGATGGAIDATNDLTAAVFTSTAANSLVFVSALDWSASGTPTSSDLTADTGHLAAQASIISGYKDAGAIGAETANINAGGTGAADWRWCALEIKAAASGASISAFQGDAFQGGAFQFGAIVSGGGGDATASPGVGSLTLTGFAGTVVADSSAAPGLQALVITGLAPTVAASFAAAPGVGSLILTGLAASVDASSSAAPGIQALVLAGLAPTVSAGVVTTPGIQALALTGFAPTVTAGSAPVDVTVTPGAGELVLQGYDPTVTVPVDVTVSPALGALIFTGYSPTATGSNPEIVGSAGPSQSATAQFNRPRPNPAHEWELELAQAARLASIAKTMAKSGRPQARRIAKKIADYTGEIKQAESLRRELAKLEAAQREKTTRTRDQISRDKELRRAANELQDILVEEDDAIQAIMDFDEYEAELMFLAFGFKIY